MSSSSQLLFSFIRGACTLAALAVEVALLVAILVGVRRHRPDAVPLLAASACAGIFGLLANSAAYAVLPSVIGRGESLFVFEAGISVVVTLIRIGGVVLLILGLLRLAAPQRGAAGFNP